ncbi:MAG: MauE/DoxX family redox-associated membrane protein [Vulcanimicrobiaceae bacterium]
MPVFVATLRIAIGLLLVAAGASKIGHFNDLAVAISGYRLLPSAVVAPLAILLPFFEIGLGFYLASGLFTRGAATVASLQFCIYAGAVASAVIRHIPANCGCFGPADSATADWPHVFFDLALAALCAFIAWRAPGSWSLDRRMRRA